MTDCWSDFDKVVIPRKGRDNQNVLFYRTLCVCVRVRTRACVRLLVCVCMHVCVLVSACKFMHCVC